MVLHLRSYSIWLTLSFALFACGACGSTPNEPRATDSPASQYAPASDKTYEARRLERACDRHDAESCFKLAIRFDQGQGVTKDPEKAKDFYKQACQGNEFQACLELYTPSCKKGDGGSCYELAKLFEQGLGVSVDMNRAEELFGEACSRGHAEGCTRIIQFGNAYADGKGVNKDETRASAILAKVCEGGNTQVNLQACFKAGKVFEEGQGPGLPDAMRAITLYSRGCEGGEMAACDYLGFMFLEGSGRAKDEGRAAALFTKSCEGGNATGCWLMGGVYMQGIGVPKDPARAVSLLVKSCDGGQGLGCFELGSRYNLGVAVKKNLARAAEFFDKGCTNRYAPSCFALGNMYRGGHGVRKDDQRATELFEEACHRRVFPACHNLANAYLAGRGGPQDLKLAAKYYRVACDGGVANACYALGEMLTTFAPTADVFQDPPRAEVMYARACELGDKRGCAKAPK